MRKKKILSHNIKEPYVDLTPTINVALLLLVVFFSVCSLTLMTGIRAVESKAGAAKGKTARSENVNVVLTKDNRLTVDGIEVNKENLAYVLRDRISQSKNQIVMVTADEENLVGQVVEILDISKQNGAKKVIIIRKAKD